MEAKLVVVGGKANMGEVKLRLPMTIGRGNKADLIIAHPTVSRIHCKLSEVDGMLVVRDNSSSNGTLVDDVQVSETIVKPGQILKVGPLSFRAEYELPQAKSKPSKKKPTVDEGKDLAETQAIDIDDFDFLADDMFTDAAPAKAEKPSAKAKPAEKKSEEKAKSKPTAPEAPVAPKKSSSTPAAPIAPPAPLSETAVFPAGGLVFDDAPAEPEASLPMFDAIDDAAATPTLDLPGFAPPSAPKVDDEDFDFLSDLKTDEPTSLAAPPKFDLSTKIDVASKAKPAAPKPFVEAAPVKEEPAKVEPPQPTEASAGADEFDFLADLGAPDAPAVAPQPPVVEPEPVAEQEIAVDFLPDFDHAPAASAEAPAEEVAATEPVAELEELSFDEPFAAAPPVAETEEVKFEVEAEIAAAPEVAAEPTVTKTESTEELDWQFDLDAEPVAEEKAAPSLTDWSPVVDETPQVVEPAAFAPPPVVEEEPVVDFAPEPIAEVPAETPSVKEPEAATPDLDDFFADLGEIASEPAAMPELPVVAEAVAPPPLESVPLEPAPVDFAPTEPEPFAFESETSWEPAAAEAAAETPEAAAETATFQFIETPAKPTTDDDAFDFLGMSEPKSPSIESSPVGELNPDAEAIAPAFGDFAAAEPEAPSPFAFDAPGVAAPSAPTFEAPALDTAPTAPAFAPAAISPVASPAAKSARPTAAAGSKPSFIDQLKKLFGLGGKKKPAAKKAAAPSATAGLEAAAVAASAPIAVPKFAPRQLDDAPIPLFGDEPPAAAAETPVAPAESAAAEDLLFDAFQETAMTETVPAAPKTPVIDDLAPIPFTPDAEAPVGNADETSFFDDLVAGEPTIAPTFEAAQPEAPAPWQPTEPGIPLDDFFADVPSEPVVDPIAAIPEPEVPAVAETEPPAIAETESSVEVAPLFDDSPSVEPPAAELPEWDLSAAAEPAVEAKTDAAEFSFDDFVADAVPAEAPFAEAVAPPSTAPTEDRADEPVDDLFGDFAADVAEPTKSEAPEANVAATPAELVLEMPVEMSPPVAEESAPTSESDWNAFADLSSEPVAETPVAEIPVAEAAAEQLPVDETVASPAAEDLFSFADEPALGSASEGIPERYQDDTFGIAAEAPAEIVSEAAAPVTPVGLGAKRPYMVDVDVRLTSSHRAPVRVAVRRPQIAVPQMEPDMPAGRMFNRVGQRPAEPQPPVETATSPIEPPMVVDSPVNPDYDATSFASPETPPYETWSEPNAAQPEPTGELNFNFDAEPTAEAPADVSADLFDAIAETPAADRDAETAMFTSESAEASFAEWEPLAGDEPIADDEQVDPSAAIAEPTDAVAEPQSDEAEPKAESKPAAAPAPKKSGDEDLDSFLNDLGMG